MIRYCEVWGLCLSSLKGYLYILFNKTVIVLLQVKGNTTYKFGEQEKKNLEE